jgi:sugar lactone lactonase YvrE
MADMEIRCIVDAHNLIGESPLWHPEHDCVYWTDINGFKIQRYAAEDGALTTWQFEEPVCALSLTIDPERILVALGSRLILWSPASDQRIDFAHPEPDIPYNRLNDGATDANGVYWVGSMRNNVARDGSHIEVSGMSGSLYRITPDGQVEVWDTGFGITNTLAWSPDLKTFYCGCSISNVIYAYDYDLRDSSIRNRRPFVAGVERGAPDGSAMDSQGYLWNCRFSGGCILRFSPTGDLDTVIEMPVSNLTNCAFGGPDLQTLYVTSAALHAPEGERFAGALFAIPTDVQGMETGRFRLDSPPSAKN